MSNGLTILWKIAKLLSKINNIWKNIYKCQKVNKGTTITKEPKIST